jgi:DnaJ-class molecular chaperone
VLGVPRDCSDDELRSAYKSALKMNHPDRVAHLSPALQAFALAETQNIRTAWEALKELRGL